MALDAILLSGIVNELKPKTEGAKIDKVQQPERDQILLTLRCGRENLKLLICAGAGTAEFS
ncbi:MAG: NFACT family protein [Oscillospiraceae bacterium]|nr:NFACT family protein [Oscillospiraceae bacterium]